ncbi:hypothetical protein FBU59_000223 [Linderina macrospora]|uniref:Uncharacterized protein n=1 Tax=Linderina macrospora TaxID=4868 RepID=A0ACC1JHN9_9FUNG|nr:hypothetical protein FBU59_000223 [Linderina macrospora]
MPIIEVSTNVKNTDSKSLSLKLATLGSQLLSKPINYMLVNVTIQEGLTLGGADKPAALVHVGSMGNVGGSLNIPIVAGINELVSRELNVDGERIVIVIKELQQSDVAENGKTFA